MATITDPTIQETIKVMELKDCLGNTRFKISLTDFDNPDYPAHDDLREWDDEYEVTVVSYAVQDTENPIVLVSQVYSEYDDAINAYKKFVYQYKTLLSAESKGWQDIHNFDEQIHYRTIDPNCCKNCKWAKPVTKDNCLFNDWKKHKARFYCTNPNIARTSKEIDPMDPNRAAVLNYHDTEKVIVRFDLAPYVYENGICDDYERALLPAESYQRSNQSYADFVLHTNATVENRRDAEIEYVVNQKMDKKINNITITTINGNDNDSNQNGTSDTEEIRLGNLGA